MYLLTNTLLITFLNTEAEENELDTGKSSLRSSLEAWALALPTCSAPSVYWCATLRCCDCFQSLRSMKLWFCVCAGRWLTYSSSKVEFFEFYPSQIPASWSTGCSASSAFDCFWLLFCHCASLRSHQSSLCCMKSWPPVQQALHKNSPTAQYPRSAPCQHAAQMQTLGTMVSMFIDEGCRFSMSRFLELGATNAFLR